MCSRALLLSTAGVVAAVLLVSVAVVDQPAAVGHPRVGADDPAPLEVDPLPTREPLPTLVRSKARTQLFVGDFVINNTRTLQPAKAPVLDAVRCAQAAVWPSPLPPLSCDRLNDTTPTDSPGVSPGMKLRIASKGENGTHILYEADRICVDDRLGMMGWEAPVAVVNVHDDWTRSPCRVSPIGLPPAASLFAPADTRAMIMPCTASTCDNTGHTIYRLAAIRLRLCSEHGLPPDAPWSVVGPLWRRHHFVVLVSSNWYAMLGPLPPEWGDRDGLRRRLAWNRFSSILGGSWSIAYDRGYKLWNVRGKAGKKKPKPPPERNDRIGTEGARAVCFHKAGIGYPYLPMYRERSDGHVAALRAFAADIVHGLGFSNASWRVEGVLRLCVLQRRGHRRFLHVARDIVALQTALGPAWSIVIVGFEDANFPEQVRIARSCTVMVGVHGAGLLNMAFAEAGSVIAELQGPSQAGTKVEEGCNVTLNLRTTSFGGAAQASAGHHCATALTPAEIVSDSGSRFRAEFNVPALPRRSIDDLVRILKRLGHRVAA